MLDPRGRQLLLSSLRPPDGFRFDCAVGTTYSLDLIALLTTPLAFAMFDWQGDDGKLAADPSVPTADPLALLESLRRCADRIHIYCQAGQIKVPPANQRLLAYLEQAVIEVNPPAAHRVFHPKVWAIRYTGPGEAVRYRLLCLSRNLTFDRSWDTVLLLDGERTDRQHGFGENRPLADFFAGLPGLASRVAGVGTRAGQDTAQIARELRIVRWELPDGVETLRFWPMGMNRKGGWPFPERMDRLLVVSPFVSDEFLGRINTGPRDVLVSRAESLRALVTPILVDKWRCFTLEDGLDVRGIGVEDTPEPAGSDTLSGLHAKVFVADAGWNAHVWTGSANATTTAFSGNVEFLVELVGKKSTLGIDATISESSGSANLRSMLAEFTPQTETVELDTDAIAVDAVIESVRQAIARLPLVVRIAADTAGGAGLVTTVECGAPLTVPVDALIRCRPVMLPHADAQVVECSTPVQARFGPHAPESVSSFVAFEVTARVGNAERTAQFVLNLPLVGAPGDRKDRLLRDSLKDTRTLLRFLLLLLSDDPEHLFDELRDLAKNPEADGSGRSQDLLPLLEHLLRALHHSPAKLDQVHRLIADLRKTPEGRSILPSALDLVWEPINRARNHSSAAAGSSGGAT